MMISIVIPVYKMDRSVEFLTQLFDSIKRQSYKRYEVIVADHSEDDEIENFCLGYDLDIKHFYNDRGRGNSSINMNFGISKSSGDVIKIMHMDDYFCNDEALNLLQDNMGDCKWGKFAFNHNYEGRPDQPSRLKVPSMSDYVVGCPSVIFFVRDEVNQILFDEELIFINDVDINQRLLEQYGPPKIIEEPSVTVRVHGSQVQNKVDPGLKHREWVHYLSKDDPLTVLANIYGTDKGTKVQNLGVHHGPRLFFTPIYHKYLGDMEFEEFNLLEIGIGSGVSLPMWSEFFPESHVYAIDVVDHRGKNTSKITTSIVDQSNRDQLREYSKDKSFDVIIDDGSHVISHQQISLGSLFENLEPGGLYFIEDLHTSDLSVWNGKTLYGYDMSCEPENTTVRVLEDYIRTKEFKSPFLTEDENRYLTDNIESLKIYDLPKTMWGENKIAVIEKKA
jgi:glycosyltransferase involved in cell wall biosynthesis